MRVLVRCLTGALICSGVIAAQPPVPAWVTAWSTSQQALGDARITNATVRMIARVTIPGGAVLVFEIELLEIVPATPPAAQPAAPPK